MDVELNNHGVNKLIQYTILSDERMRKIGFTDHSKDSWYFCRRVKFPNNRRYTGFDITFNVTIPKDKSDISIDILDEHFLQPYDYQHMLDVNPGFEPCLIVKEQVEEWMEFLHKSGVISGHLYGEYI